MKILTVCPSIYPKKFKEMEDSFYKTIEQENILYEVNCGTVTEAINFGFKKYPNMDFYHITNDDVIYQMQGWDTKLSNKEKISYGDDLFQRGNLCTFPMIDGDIVRSIGWLQLPTLKRYCGDIVWKTIGLNLNILNYVPEVIIEHKWEGCSDENMNKEDMEKFAQWLPRSYKDINKIKELLNGKTSS